MTDNARDDVAPITLSEHSRLLIASHRAMRADGRRLITATHRLQDRRPSDALALGRAFAEIVTLIHDHHRAEDDVLYPFLITRLPTSNTTPYNWRATTSPSTPPWPASPPAYVSSAGPPHRRSDTTPSNACTTTPAPSTTS